jgi:uncharacterized membrane protein
MRRLLINKCSSILASFLATVALACSAAQDSNAGNAAVDSAGPAADTDSRMLRGLIPAHTRSVVVPCGGTDTLQLQGSAVDIPATDTGAVFVMLAGLRRAGQFTVEQVLYTSNERFECFTDWSGFSYRATGQSPGWVAEVAGDQVVLRREGGAAFTWSAVQKDSTADALRFRATAADGGALELTLRQQSCRNPVSGARSAWSAQLVSGVDRLTGCAVPGAPR